MLRQWCNRLGRRHKLQSQPMRQLRVDRTARIPMLAVRRGPTMENARTTRPICRHHVAAAASKPLASQPNQPNQPGGLHRAEPRSQQGAPQPSLHPDQHQTVELHPTASHHANAGAPRNRADGLTQRYAVSVFARAANSARMMNSTWAPGRRSIMRSNAATKRVHRMERMIRTTFIEWSE